VSDETIHTALLDIARAGHDEIPLGEGLYLVKPNDQLLASRWNWVQGQGEMDEEASASRYLVCKYPSWIFDVEPGVAAERGANRFYAGLMAIQVIKPIQTLGFIYRRQQIERRPPMQPGSWGHVEQVRRRDADAGACDDRAYPASDGW
jgi:hypothetical protein